MKRTFSIEELLAKLNISRHELADKAGVSPQTVWRWTKEGIPERGAARALLERLAEECA